MPVVSTYDYGSKAYLVSRGTTLEVETNIQVVLVMIVQGLEVFNSCSRLELSASYHVCQRKRHNGGNISRKIDKFFGWREIFYWSRLESDEERVPHAN